MKHERRNRSARRSLLAALGLSLLVATPLFHAPLARAQDKPIEWVVGYAPGGGSDVVARAVALEMGKTLSRTLVVSNKPGAATNVAAEYVARSKEVGSVMLTADFATLAANPSLFSKLPYDPERDFKPVGLLARFPLLLVVGPNVPAKNYREFVDWVKAQPQGASFASAGPGSPHHLAGELLRERTGLKLQHVGYRGAGPAVQDLIGGQVPFGLIDTASAVQHLPSGKLRALAVASAKRLPALPDVPTLNELGLTGFEAYAWQGLVAPAATSPATLAQWSRALQAALKSDSVKQRFDALALEALPGTPEQMAAYARSERERWGRIIKSNGIKID